MKIAKVASLMHSMPMVLVVLVLLPAQQLVFADQDAGTVDRVPMAMPITMTVELVDRESGTVVLDGEVYRLPHDADDAISSAYERLENRPVTIRELVPGMQVTVITDGTSPEGGHQPQILAMVEAGESRQ